jgi:hypothetical protein
MHKQITPEKTTWINKQGLYHREDGPAIEWADGGKEWWINGELHRLDGPARTTPEGDTEWWLNGKLHRTDGPAAEYDNGAKYWSVHGKFHRLDGPASVRTLAELWYVNDCYVKIY